MKNRKGNAEAVIFVSFVIALFILLLVDVNFGSRIDRAIHHKTNIRCIETMKVPPTLKDSLRLYKLYPECLNVTPKDTLHV